MPTRSTGVALLVLAGLVLAAGAVLAQEDPFADAEDPFAGADDPFAAEAVDLAEREEGPTSNETAPVWRASAGVSAGELTGDGEDDPPDPPAQPPSDEEKDAPGPAIALVFAALALAARRRR